MEKLKIVLRHNNWLGTMEHGWGNGYVALPKEHPFNGVHYDSIPVDIHGGLTYAEWGTHANKAPFDCVFEPDDWVVGFDTAHYQDTAARWTQNAVRKETESLARQLENLWGHTGEIVAAKSALDAVQLALNLAQMQYDALVNSLKAG